MTVEFELHAHIVTFQWTESYQWYIAHVNMKHTVSHV